MKNVAIFIACLLVTFSVSAQDKNQENSGEMKTIFGKNGQPSVGWFIGIDHSYTQFDNRDVWMGGLNFGMVIDHHFSLGLAGQGWCNRNGMYYSDITDTAGAYLEGGYGGLLLAYTLFPQAPVHVTFPVIIGAGGASYVTEKEYYEWDEDEWDENHAVIDDDAFFVVEPGIMAEVNLLKFMKLNAGISYRFVDGLQLVNTSDNMMNNFNATVGLKFGKF